MNIDNFIELDSLADIYENCMREDQWNTHTTFSMFEWALAIGISIQELDRFLKRKPIKNRTQSLLYSFYIKNLEE